MKAVTRYQSEDGSMFDTEARCVAYESLVAQLERLERTTLGEKIKDPNCRFANGAGFVRHEETAVKQAHLVFMAICTTILKEDYTGKFQYLGRVLSDGNSAEDNALYGFWSRLFCIDKANREWGQPFYALNPDQGTQKEFLS